MIRYKTHAMDTVAHTAWTTLISSGERNGSIPNGSVSLDAYMGQAIQLYGMNTYLAVA